MHLTRSLLPLLFRWVAGAVFVFVAFGKFFNHANETADFRRYGIPLAAAAVLVSGIVEMSGGLALIVGVATRPAAVALGANLIGAIITAGRIEGGAFNLVLAPSLLVAMVFLMWFGSGGLSVDRHLRR